MDDDGKAITTVAVVHEYNREEYSTPDVWVYQIRHAATMPHPDVQAAWERAILAFRARGLRPPHNSRVPGILGIGWTVIDIIEDELALFRENLQAQGLEFVAELHPHFTYDNT